MLFWSSDSRRKSTIAFHTSVTTWVFYVCFSVGCGDPSDDANGGGAGQASVHDATAVSVNDSASSETSKATSASVGENLSSPTPADQPTAAPEGTEGSAAAGGPALATFTGRVVLDGDAPRPAPLIPAGSSNVKDPEVCGLAEIPDESLLIGKDNGIANVFVYLRRAPKGPGGDAPEEPVVLDQKSCVFLPHAALIRAGQPVLVKSSDACQHNIHTFPGRNQQTNLLISPNDQAGVELVYERPENDPLQVKCDIHAWMSSWHLVLDHPFMAITDADGNFSIEGLPTGRYEFRVWHERSKVLEKGYAATVAVDSEPVVLTYGLDRFPAVP